jgi:hypothetical protein
MGTLTEHVHHFALSGRADGLCGQLIEEMAPLACRLREAAESMTRAPAPSDSGIFARRHLDAEDLSLDSISD